MSNPLTAALASKPAQASVAAPARSAAKPVNDHDADDLPGATAKAPPASGTGLVLDKVA